MPEAMAAAPQVVLAGLRDASWHASIGRGGKFHIAILDEKGGAYPACNRNALLVEDELIPAPRVSLFSRCARPGCRARWPK